MSAGLRFRRATEADIPAIVALVESAYRGWRRPHSAVLLAEREEGGDARELLACAHIAIEDGAGYFGMFSVRPALQGGGIGKALLAEAERLAREEWRLRVMRMTVIDLRDELIAFYERRGYRRTGITRPFPYGDERFGLPKRPDLRFEVLEKPLDDDSAG